MTTIQTTFTYFIQEVDDKFHFIEQVILEDHGLGMKHT